MTTNLGDTRGSFTSLPSSLASLSSMSVTAALAPYNSMVSSSPISSRCNSLLGCESSAHPRKLAGWPSTRRCCGWASYACPRCCRTKLSFKFPLFCLCSHTLSCLPVPTQTLATPACCAPHQVFFSQLWWPHARTIRPSWKRHHLPLRLHTSHELDVHYRSRSSSTRATATASSATTAAICPPTTS